MFGAALVNTLLKSAAVGRFIFAKPKRFQIGVTRPRQQVRNTNERWSGLSLMECLNLRVTVQAWDTKALCLRGAALVVLCGMGAGGTVYLCLTKTTAKARPHTRQRSLFRLWLNFCSFSAI
jgi:hypothetical protein